MSLTLSVCELNIVSYPGPYLCLGHRTSIVSGHVSSRIQLLLYPGNKTWNVVSTLNGFGIAGHPSLRVHVGHGVNEKKNERRTAMMSGRKRNDWRRTFVSWAKKRCTYLETPPKQHILYL